MISCIDINFTSHGNCFNNVSTYGFSNIYGEFKNIKLLDNSVGFITTGNISVIAENIEIGENVSCFTCDISPQNASYYITGTFSDITCGENSYVFNSFGKILGSYKNIKIPNIGNMFISSYDINGQFENITGGGNSTYFSVSLGDIRGTFKDINLGIGSSIFTTYDFLDGVFENINLPTLDGTQAVFISGLTFSGTFSNINIGDVSQSFWVSLIYVSYAYSGWNAASYLAGDMKDVKKDLPKALIIGTLIVTAIYVLLNYVFLYSTPASELAGVLEIGHVSASHIFGAFFGKFMSLVIAFLLVSSISAMIMAGPRIIKSMGEDVPMLHFLAITNKNNVPYLAVLLQSAITVILILTSQFNSVLTFVGFSLSIFTFLTVMSIFILRFKKIENTSYKTWGYPVTPILFLALNGFTIYFVFINKTEESLWGLLNLVIGASIYFIGKQFSKNKHV